MNILILDTSFAAAPIYEAIISAGHDVWVMGNREDDLLARLARDRWINESYSDLAAVETHIALLGIEYVVPGCTDVSMEVYLRIAACKSIKDSPETYEKIGNKARFRALCAELDLPAPKAVDAASLPKAGKYICKPVDSFSGRGITVFDGLDTPGLELALREAQDNSRSGRAIIESYADGDLYSCSGFLEDGRLTDIFYVKEGSSVNRYAVDTSFVITEMRRGIAEILQESLERLAQALELKDGLLHTQFILSEEGPLIIEIARRCPGDLYSLLIQHSTGFPYAAKYASYFYPTDTVKSVESKKYILRHTVSADQEGYFNGLVCQDPLPLKAFYPLTPLGSLLHSQQKTRVGILFLECPSYVELEETYEKFLGRRAYGVI